MNDAMRKSRAEKILKFGIYINGLLEHKGDGFSRKVFRRLADYRRQFKAVANDSILSEVLKIDLLIIDEVEQFVAAKNAGDEVGAKRHRAEVIRLWNVGDLILNRINEELKNDVF